MSAAEARGQGHAPPELHCRVERGPVVIRIGDAALPAATVQPEMPGSEYVRVFDLVHAAVLRWSPNVNKAVSGGVPGLGGAADDCPVEDSIDALTYAVVLHRSDLTTGTAVDPTIVATVLALACRRRPGPGTTACCGHWRSTTPCASTVTGSWPSTSTQDA